MAVTDSCRDRRARARCVRASVPQGGSRRAGAVVCINLSVELSATIESGGNAARLVEGDIDVRVVDPAPSPPGWEASVEAAAKAGIRRQLDRRDRRPRRGPRARTHIFAALDTLDNLKKGGRIGGAQAMLGTMLSIKPIVDIRVGEVEEAAKQRTRRRPCWLRDKVFAIPQLDHLSVCGGEAPDVDEFLDLLAPRYSGDRGDGHQSAPSSAPHGGPRVLGTLRGTTRA